jgi:hypothetical protein
MIISKYMKHNDFKELFWVSLIIAGVMLFTYIFEKPLSLENATMFDGSVYYRISEKIVLHQQINDEAPFVYRLGTPFLVSWLFPDNLFLGYKIINLIASVICVYLLLYWLRLYLKNIFIRMILIGLFASHWLGVLRITLYNPVHVEAIPLIFNLLGLIYIFYLREQPNNPRLIAIFSVTMFVGVIFRESVIFIPLAYLILHAHELIRAIVRIKLERIHVFSVLPFIFGLAGVLLTRLLAEPSDMYYLVGAMVLWFYMKPFPAYVQSYFTTFGPMLAVLIPSVGVIKKFLLFEKFNFYYLIMICSLAWGIGSDTDRFIYWTMPVWYVMFGLALEYLWPMLRRRWILLIIILLLQGLAQRSFLGTPEYAPEKILYRIPVLTVICNEGCGLDVPSYNGITGPGINAAMCTPSPCIKNGALYPLQLFLFMENVAVVGILAYFLLRMKMNFLASQSGETSLQAGDV